MCIHNSPSFSSHVARPPAHGSAPHMARLALAANREDEGGVDWRHIVVQHHVPGHAAADNQLAQTGMNRSPDQGMLPKHVPRADDQPDARGRLARITGIVGVPISPDTTSGNSGHPRSWPYNKVNRSRHYPGHCGCRNLAGQVSRSRFVCIVGILICSSRAISPAERRYPPCATHAGSKMGSRFTQQSGACPHGNLF